MIEPPEPGTKYGFLLGLFMGSAFFYPMMGRSILFGLGSGAISTILAWIAFWVWERISAI